MGPSSTESTESTFGGLELTSVRVIDFSSGIAGAYCAKMFSDAGADVVLVEPIGGAALRTWTCSGPTTPGTDGALFRYLRHGQRAVIDNPGADHDLLRGADVVITDSTDADSRVAPEALHAAHPHLVVLAITAFGLHGPSSGRPASELIVQAESGALAIRGRHDRPPVQAGGQVTEWVTGAYAAAAGIAALHGRQTSGRGALVDVSWCEVANMTCTLFSDTFDAVAGRPDLADAPPSRSFETPSVEPTLDGYVGFNTNTRQQFEDFLVLIERTDLLADPSWASLAIRTAKWDEWNEIVHAWTTQHTTADIVEQAALLRIPVSPVADAPKLLQLEHPVQRGVFIEDPTGEFRIPRRPWTIDAEPAPAPRPAPRLGEHTGRIEPSVKPPSPQHDDAPGSPELAPSLPLAGLRVLDLTAWWAGPSATALLAALGADVVHVESTKRPDGIRMAGGAFIARPQWWELSPFFLAANTNKRDLTLDLSSPVGRELLLGLVADADIVIENFTPRVLESFDLGWDVIHAANPRTVMVRMPAFGLDGPWRDRPGFAQTMEQMTGLAWLTGYVDDQPRIQRGPCDPNGGMHAAFAALVALARRDRTGLGSLVETPMFEAAVAVAAEPVIEYTAYGNVLGRDGNRSLRAAPQGVYECAGREQWLALSVLDDTQWKALVGAMGSPSWAADPTLATASGRRAHHDELDVQLGRWAADRPLADAVDALLSVGVPAAPAVEPRRSHLNPQFVERGYFEVVDHPVAGPLDTPTLPFRWSGIERWVRTPAPTMGQHNTEILAALGCTPTEIDNLTATGVIGTAPSFQ